MVIFVAHIPRIWPARASGDYCHLGVTIATLVTLMPSPPPPPPPPLSPLCFQRSASLARSRKLSFLVLYFASCSLCVCFFLFPSFMLLPFLPSAYLFVPSLGPFSLSLSLLVPSLCPTLFLSLPQRKGKFVDCLFV